MKVSSEGKWPCWPTLLVSSQSHWTLSTQTVLHLCFLECPCLDLAEEAQSMWHLSFVFPYKETRDTEARGTIPAGPSLGYGSAWGLNPRLSLCSVKWGHNICL